MMLDDNITNEKTRRNDFGHYYEIYIRYRQKYQYDV